ncbi:Ankyrin repeat and KH domain-containing protein 1 [Hondaea fermentalgiana]|uniref:Ankyrin repeat and KH domain-containing protein 1 n=1 Tax=Hondaea fermentalgiana TaxID=2315210 RepID=A0A2R5GGR8_9STRA|nr:Ankyrin repeat and KH domain-containing protein 1 [Hondaea fermentalgiana]|eukprot:GBG27853.1 Ankyrin repeat and KH domain-containing protein 1 [Hondaea fermentalgiana]
MTATANLLIERGAQLHPKAVAYAISEDMISTAELAIQRNAPLGNYGGKTPLMYVCAKGLSSTVALLALESIKAVGLLIEAGADLDLQDDDGDTALICACVDGHSDMAKLLIQSGANISLCNKYRESPVASCCASGMSSVAELLIERGAKMSFHTKESATTSFLEAVAADTAVMVHAMLERGVKLDLKRVDGALLLAVQKGCTESAQVMIEARFGVDFRNENGDHPLSVAVEKGDETIVSLLVQRGVPMDLAFDKSSRPRTPLMEAARLARADLVSLLVDAGAMVDEISSDIRHDADDGPASAQRFTRRYSMSSATKRLRLCARRSRSTLEKTDDMEGPARDLGRSALMYACEVEDGAAATEVLLASGAHSELQDLRGESALSLAAGNDRSDTVALLVGAGAQVDSRNERGRTPLMIACLNGSVEVTEILIDGGAQVDLTDNDGWSAIMLASRKLEGLVIDGHLRCIQKCWVAGADLSITSTGSELLYKSLVGQDALGIARYLGAEEIEELLQFMTGAFAFFLENKIGLSRDAIIMISKTNFSK